MSKAEERALERFPVHEGASEEWIKVHLKNICGDYIEGYQQAEKDVTDAFIEKACAWFRTLDDKEPPYETTEEFIEGFKKAMKL